MGGRLKTNGGQLVPLKDRINKHQMQKRSEKMQARRDLAQQLMRNQEHLAYAVASEFYRRSFKGRWQMLVRRVRNYFAKAA
jgi:hypothetical protein